MTCGIYLQYCFPDYFVFYFSEPFSGWPCSVPMSLFHGGVALSRSLFHIGPILFLGPFSRWTCLYLSPFSHCTCSVYRSLFQVGPTDVVFHASPLTFDPSIVEIFIALTTGATLLLMPDNIKLNTSKMVDILCRNKTTVMQVDVSCFWFTFIGYAGFLLLGGGMWHDYVSELFVLLE